MVPSQSQIQDKLQFPSRIDFKAHSKLDTEHMNVQREGGILPSLERFIQDAPFQQSDNMIIALPHVAEDILKQDMERDQDSMNQGDNNL